MDGLTIRLLEAKDVPVIGAAFDRFGWSGRAAMCEQYLREQNNSERVALVALVDGVFAGYVTMKRRSDYPPFAESGIPEIADLNVLPGFRRRGIGSQLVDEAERRIFERSTVAGIGFGISAGYGPAQRMYIKRGYVPDGRGLFAGGHFVPDGATVCVLDSAIYLTKERPERV